jgi:hypothetical protein
MNAPAVRSQVPHPPGVVDGESGWRKIREQMIDLAVELYLDMQKVVKVGRAG